MSPTLATVATAFLQRQGLASSTLRSYELTLLPLLKEWGRMPIELLDRQTLKEYLNSLDKIKYTTHNRHQAVLTALFNFAVSTGYIKSNPIERLPLRKPSPSKGEHRTDEVIRYLTPSQLETLYASVSDNPRLNALVRLLHRTGARISEVLALDLEDIDTQHCKFQVIGKGNRQRWCFYSSDAALSVQKYVKYYRYSGCTALFTAQHPLTKQVTRLSYRTAHSDWMNTVGSSPELKGIRLHDLRHTFATERVGLMGIEELRALMGHQNIQTTLRYSHVTSSRAEEVAKNALSLLIKH